MSPVHALTLELNGLYKQIITEVIVTNPITKESIRTYGIWDTGATDSAITKEFADLIGLNVVSYTTVQSAHTTQDVPVYNVTMTLHNKNITKTFNVTECCRLSNDSSINVLIGMNIISMGDFAISNFNGKTVMSFRMPSIQSIDFVKSINRKIPFINTNLPSRNQTCPCGSGKKYKHCCGKK
jgi:hypothetical protein